MSLCVMNPVRKTIKDERNKTKTCALKVIGVDNSDLSNEEILECITDYVEPGSIEALVYDYFNNFYVVFLTDIESACRLVGKMITFQVHEATFLPFLDYYIVDNVYPSLSHGELRDIFRAFGNVFSVSNHHVLPNSSKFSHVLSGKREISFVIPGKDSEIYIPMNIIQPPFSFHVKKLCCACLTEGHSILHCPDIEDDVVDEVDAIIKSENIFESKEVKIEELSPNHSCSEENLMETVELVKDKIEVTTETASKTSVVEIENISNLTEKEDEPDPPEIVPSTSTCEQNSATSSADKTIVVDSLHGVKTKNAWSPLAEDLISRHMSTLEANVLKHLLFLDGKQKADIIEYTFSCLKDVRNFLPQLKIILLKCYERKYSSLLGPFSRKIQTISLILSKHDKK